MRTNERDTKEYWEDIAREAIKRVILLDKEIQSLKEEKSVLKAELCYYKEMVKQNAS